MARADMGLIDLDAYSKALLSFGEDEVSASLPAGEWIELEAIIDMIIEHGPNGAVNAEGLVALAHLRDSLVAQFREKLPSPTAVELIAKMREAGLVE